MNTQVFHKISPETVTIYSGLGLNIALSGHLAMSTVSEQLPFSPATKVAVGTIAGLGAGLFTLALENGNRA